MRTFTAFGKEFFYYQELGERTVEIPIAWEVYSRWKNKKVIEVGNVIGRQMRHGRLSTGKPIHRVVDLYDPEEGCEKIDAMKVDYRGSHVLSISTLEHFGTDDYGNHELNKAAGIDCLMKIISESDGYFITVPVGYNQEFDHALRQLKINFHFLKQVAGPSNNSPSTMPEWVQKQEPDWLIKYGDPFHYANAILVISNVPWILNHEAIHRSP